MTKKATGISDQAPTGNSIWVGNGYLDFSQVPMDVSSIDIDIIARALSRVPRFAGLSDRFYSVAQHSVVLSLYFDYDSALAKFALLHDATEAFMCDIPAPLKSLLPEYEKIEKRLMAAILKRFNVDDLSPHITHADKFLARWEATAINKTAPPWVLRGTEYEFMSSDLAHRINRNEPWGYILINALNDALPLSPTAAEAAFLLRYQELFT